MKTNRIEEEVKHILDNLNIQSPPVPVDTVATQMGLRLEAAALGDNVSGILVLDAGAGTIGYNNSHALVRQRFSIAHELGHYVLHKTSKSLFIDKRYVAVYHRDEQSSTGEDLFEIEANKFAAALLMPESMIRDELTDSSFYLDEEEVLTSLAQKFKVSTQAMAFRLANLGYLNTPSP